MEDHGIPLNRDLLLNSKLDPDSATEATRILLSLENPPDAICAINDTVAFAAMTEIKRQGYSIPGDIGIVGFTDNYHASIVDPPLSSVQHPTLEMGRTAARLLLEQLDGNTGPQRIELDTELVIRGSS